MLIMSLNHKFKKYYQFYCNCKNNENMTFPFFAFMSLYNGSSGSIEIQFYMYMYIERILNKVNEVSC